MQSFWNGASSSDTARIPGIAPVAVGRDANPNSRRHDAEVWARELYNRPHSFATE